ncbi:hypothetical protein JG687_00019207 [Phytophthora cactorum]|nr:hypothetical protein Pcac1_g8836 [Phytophthora cactorum]KAG2791863.1 hypothetical protein PC111_g23726 [Phytophthora cactorum]KAG2810828.1 hypothetical protein PC113_g23722 [Phytophthora cactorum]KAG2880481.1 hypothetical protein PC117_g26552 [Phytophthora cactorum]KAG2960507.1 hypothetical protein PC119_g26370 [Phytophthora cactorum]
MVSMKVRLTGLINQSPQYVIDQSRVPIYFVASKKDWNYCASGLLKAQVMGFDTETRPIWSKHQRRNPSALLQIAVRDASHKEEVFILDLLHLSAKVYNTTLTSVFLSKAIVKLGQSFYQDLQELAQSYPQASCFTVCKGVVEVNDLSISLAGAHNPLSLQKLVFFYLHRKLAKTQQMSNWARRPLSPSQLHYAAADGLVLIHLYDELLMRIQKQRSAKNYFRLSDVTNVLDVNLPPTPKCPLCFNVFETRDQLKKHRKLCTADVRALVICEVCEGKKLVTEKVMKYHVKRCGVDDGADEPVVVVKRKRSLSMDHKKSLAKTLPASSVLAPISKKRRLETPEQVKAAQDPNSITAEQESNKPLTKGQKKKERKRKAKALAALKAQLSADDGLSEKTAMSSSREQEEYRKRKMSMESSLLASDAMWSQISSDCESFTTAT